MIYIRIFGVFRKENNWVLLKPFDDLVWSVQQLYNIEKY